HRRRGDRQGRARSVVQRRRQPADRRRAVGRRDRRRRARPRGRRHPADDRPPAHPVDPGGDDVNVLGDGIKWLFDPGNWWGDRGLIQRTIEHLAYSGIALLVAFVIAFPIGLLIGHSGRGRFAASGSANLLRAIPTYGVVSLLFLWKPVTLWPMLIALAILAIPPIMLNTAAGIANVDPQTRDAAIGVGLTGRQVLTQVEISNALPLI